MSKEDIARVALGAPALQSVVVVELPDCLAVKHWSRDEAGDGDVAAAHLGNVFRAARDAAQALGDAREIGPVTVETDAALMMVASLGPDAAAGFVFDKSAALGLVRVQVRQLSDHLKALLPSLKGSQDLARDLGATLRPEPAPHPTVVAPPRPSVVPPPPHPSSLSTPPPAAPTVTPRPSAPEMPAAPREAEDAPRPRAVRLLEFFRRYAPDPHASMLRLSLRTGISLEQLEQPGALEEAQVEALAAAVRDILGQEQVGV